MWHNKFCENKSEAVETHIPRHRDSKTKKPRHGDSKTKKPRHRDSKAKKPRHRDSKTKKLQHRETETTKPRIVIPRHFFRGRKATTTIFQD